MLFDRGVSPLSDVLKDIGSVIDLLVPEIVIVASGGGDAINIEKYLPENSEMIVYEKNRDTWLALHEKLRDTSIFNQPFGMYEDVYILGGQNPKTCVIFNPSWIEEGKSFDRSNFLLNSIKLNGIFLDEWCSRLGSAGYQSVILHLPPLYEINLPGKIVVDYPDRRLVYYTQDASTVEKISKATSVEQTENAVVKSYHDDKPSFKEAHDLPPRASIRGPKIVCQTFLSPSFPRQRYYPNPYVNPKAISITPRCLLLGEMEFLLRNPEVKKVVYIGGGLHLKTLSSFFPEIKFDHFNTVNLKSTDVPSSVTKDSITTFKTSFSQMNVYTEKILLICDLPDHLQTEREILSLLRPHRGLLSFILPNNALSTEFFDGVIFFQVYSHPHIFKTRIEVVANPKVITFSNLTYTEQLFYFNIQYRIQGFQHYTSRFGWSYDTTREYFILKKYLRHIGRGDNELVKILQVLDALSNSVDHHILSILKRYGVEGEKNEIKKEDPPKAKLEKILEMDESKVASVSKYAFVTLVMKKDGYIPGALVTAWSLKTKYDKVCMVTPDVSEEGKEQLRQVFDQVIDIEYLEYKSMTLTTKRQQDLYKEWVDVSYTKWNCLKLTQYEKVIFIDADQIALRDIDELFKLQAPAATFANPWIKHGPYKKLKHGHIVNPEEIRQGLSNYVITGTIVLLKPSEEDFKEYCGGLENKVNGYPGCNSMLDEQTLTAFYLDKKVPWTYIDTNYNHVTWFPNFSRKPATFHYFGTDKPWNVDRSKWLDLEPWWNIAANLSRKYPMLKHLFKYVDAKPIVKCFYCKEKKLPFQHFLLDEECVLQCPQLRK